MTTYNGKSAIESTEQSLPTGVPCTHPGCLHHVSHPCEGCGRIAGITPDTLTQYDLPSVDSTEEMRREFEEWHRTIWKEIPVWWTADAWNTWQAAIASKQEELAQAEEQIRKLKSELEDANAMNLLGTQQCIYTDVSNALKQANATIATLEAKIEEAAKQEPVGYQVTLVDPDDPEFRPVSLAEHKSIHADCINAPLFTRPPITSERELELLGVIEQMKGLLAIMRDKIIPDKPQADHITIKDASGKELVVWCRRVDGVLALTPDITPRGFDSPSPNPES